METSRVDGGIVEHVSSKTAEDDQRCLSELRPIPDQRCPRRLIVFHRCYDAELVMRRLVWMVLQLLYMSRSFC